MNNFIKWLCCLALFSLSAVPFVYAYPVSTPFVPATSTDGSYTVSWMYAPNIVQEKMGTGEWVDIQAPYVSLSLSFNGKPEGTYQYRTKLVVFYPVGGGTILYSDPAQIIVQYPPPVPATPTGFNTPATSSDGTYLVSWAAVSGATSYLLKRKKNIEDWTTRQDSTSLSASEVSLQDGEYSYKVKACNESGCSAYTSVKTTNVTYPSSPPSSSNISGKYRNYTPYYGDLNGDGFSDFYFHSKRIFLSIGGIHFFVDGPPTYALLFDPSTQTYLDPVIWVLSDADITALSLTFAQQGVHYYVLKDSDGNGRQDLLIQGTQVIIMY